MKKDYFGWSTDRLPCPARVVRWGHYGQPVLIYPTAGGDFEEIERFQLIAALAPLIDAGRIKVYSVDSVAGQHWLSHHGSIEYRSRVQNSYDAYVYREVVPLIRNDCGGAALDVITAGASIGAFNATAALVRHPDVFRVAIGMSGTYDLSRYVEGRWNDDFYFSSPLHFLPGFNDAGHLHALRRRFVILATGEGRWEDPAESWRMADALGTKGIPNRVDQWGREWDHDWYTWRVMLPRYLAELA
ncbi:MAG TPA: alpha/beta hydrolase-fold protein [Steroidobacteraceae bacterium]|nr:alpha/beta hydrolase-fold protein [Steroidobacteraceae bacterium]